MDTKLANKQIRLREWAGIIKDCCESGMDINTEAIRIRDNNRVLAKGIEFNEKVTLDANKFWFIDKKSQSGTEKAVFLNWNIIPDGSGTVFENSQPNVDHKLLNIYPGTNVVTIYAQWDKNTLPPRYEEGYYRITINGSDGEDASYFHYDTDGGPNNDSGLYWDITSPGDAGAEASATYYLSQGTVLAFDEYEGEKGSEYNVAVHLREPDKELVWDYEYSIDKGEKTDYSH